MTATPEGPVAFVLGGGGILGAAEVGMARALADAGVRPDLILGTSIGALNGAFLAADAGPAGADRLAGLWRELSSSAVFSESLPRRLGTLARTRTHLHPRGPLRRLLLRHQPAERIEDLPVHFECVAASIEQAAEHWFDAGPLADAVLASCAVPGLFAPVRIGNEHYYDGGLVHSIPVGRAVALGAGTIYVLQVGRIEQRLRPPGNPLEVGMVAFEIARRHRFAADMASLPAEVTVHVLPSGSEPRSPRAELDPRNYRRTGGVTGRIERAYDASMRYLSDVRA
ncbi:MAG TPA: patatin-like phospholipase family protein [Frankiaceae bacterium]|nr:patatin-like phospholipase family protein [Frankiaceae bacterium]